ncbi:hypothetical protein N5J77_26205 [Sphingobium yanoikuyae]|uniref:M28 family peptidase n=1 Tax=Sphingobium yanoikuyae TaxID=13690 RepID=A0AA42X2B8_SPHYA|nr:hypothetical protein [Sphingobium yanoikuyae]MDH2134632.1 hypothetical protein [Sphingobium yanoikuyae]MDH2152200.1 hypothetical protein [Sphingobium yanoikuyae]MDH2170030.1 hypothetical protein [Sphingobium yanoikuyae]
MTFKAEGLDRRDVLASMAALPFALGPVVAVATDSVPGIGVDRIAEDIQRYIGFGAKASGGAGDTASGAWIGEELAKAGYAVERAAFEAPYFDPAIVQLRIDGRKAELIPQAIVQQTSADGVKGALFHFDPERPLAIPAKAIVLVDLPKRAWSTATDPVIRRAIAACVDADASGIVLITNGPTGEAIALNAPADAPLSSIPTACLAPRDAAPFLLAAHTQGEATLLIVGRAGRRPAFNIMGRWAAPEASKKVIVTTPRSGWLTCAAERAPGIAAWLDLMRWLPTSGLALDVVFSSNSGHEYENLGASHQVEGRLPRPEETALFLLFGASIVTKATLEQDGHLRIMSKPSEKRACIVTAREASRARKYFAGWAGWTDPAIVTDGGAGEAGTAIKAGYPNVIGLIGANPYHHVAGDTGAIVDAGYVRQIAQASRKLLQSL